MRSLSVRSLAPFALAALASIASAALVGCAADTANTDGTESTESLTAFGKKVAGNYHYDTAYKFYDTLSLVDGSYSATLKPCPAAALCAIHLETGTWTANASASTLTLHPKGAAKKVFNISLAGDGSGMKISDGVNTEGLVRDAVGPIACASDSDCTKTQECLFVSNCPPAKPGTVTCHSGRDLCVEVATAGQSCGFRTQSVTCARGLDCAHVSGTPLDALTCTAHVAAYGESCGGFMANAAKCDAGLVCTHLNADGTFFSNPDAPGVCRVDVGGKCGGNMTTAHECAYPMHCESLMADLPGNCVK